MVLSGWTQPAERFFGQLAALSDSLCCLALDCQWLILLEREQHRRTDSKESVTMQSKDLEAFNDVNLSQNSLNN